VYCGGGGGTFFFCVNDTNFATIELLVLVDVVIRYLHWSHIEVC
jgi:hypothetical protein